MSGMPVSIRVVFDADICRSSVVRDSRSKAGTGEAALEMRDACN